MQKPDGNKDMRLAAFGEFLLRLHSNSGKRFQQTDGYTAYYAGAEANVCVLLARLGIPVDYITRVPDNDIAAAGIQQLRSQGVETSKIQYGGHKLGLYFTESGNHIRPARVIYDRTGTAFDSLQPGDMDWKSILQHTHYFHWSGVAAALSDSAAAVCAEALTAAREAGLIISADFNYRTTLWKYGKHPQAVMPALLQHSDIAVADLDAVQVYYGITTDPQLPVAERFRQCFTALQPHMPRLKTLGMSFRRTEGNQLWYSGALAHAGDFYFSKGFALSHVTDQIGTGDAFTAGMLHGLMRGEAPQTIIDFATACGTLKQSIPGDWAIISRQEVETLMTNGLSGRIVR
ncbi:sugar kinase [Chitinophaga nivalis]|uniref:Sugar kinase n=1 Tax=Chitinophaga nivalis TaxID=2991709 RepID=A0ABT3INR5_9BACT|nr:sugar kinase [Chitinophaga nivalis]MCW3464884.1 sugar kinase [Chitinophaga nivalis]MCW3485425.1 sugar kinase [Chitinophaga nivalis]